MPYRIQKMSVGEARSWGKTVNGVEAAVRYETSIPGLQQTTKPCVLRRAYCSAGTMSMLRTLPSSYPPQAQVRIVLCFPFSDE